jgi:hypothetical protein
VGMEIALSQLTLPSHLQLQLQARLLQILSLLIHQELSFLLLCFLLCLVALLDSLLMLFDY